MKKFHFLFFINENNKKKLSKKKKNKEKKKNDKKLETILYLKKIKDNFFNHDILNKSLLELIKQNLKNNKNNIWTHLINMINSYQNDNIEFKKTKFDNWILKIEDVKNIFKNDINYHIYTAIISLFLNSIVDYLKVNTVKWSGEIKIDYIIPLNSIISIIYNNLLNSNISEQISTECINNFIEILIEKNIISKIIEKKLDKIKLNWILKIDNNHLTFLLHEALALNLFQHLYIDCKPPKWFFNKNNVYNENLLINQKNTFLTKVLNKNDILFFTNEKYINMINSLQEIAYIIDIKLLKLFFKNISYTNLKSHLNDDIIIPIYHDYFSDTYQYIIDKSKKKNKKTSLHIDNLLYQELNDIFIFFGINISEFKTFVEGINKKYDSYNEKKKHIIVRRLVYCYLKKNIKFNLAPENKQFLHINDLIILLFLVFYKENSEITHLIRTDLRGRLYTQGAISYINDKFLRLFVHIKMNVKLIKKKFDVWYKYYFSNQLKKCINISEALSIYDNYIKNLNENELLNKILTDENLDIYNKIKLLKLIKKKNNTTISLDATSSLLQIIGVLTKNKKLLYYTNLIDPNESKDIYSYLIDILSNVYKYDKYILYYKNRKIVKYVCMTYLFGSTAKHLSIDMKEKFNIKLLLKDLITISNNIINIFKKEFKVIPILKKIFNEYILLFPSKVNISYQIWDKKLEYNMSKPKKKVFKKELSKELPEVPDVLEVLEVPEVSELSEEFINNSKNNNIYKNKKYLFYMSIKNFNNDKKDLLKKKKSAFVNVIHSLDSQICIKTRYNLLKKKIKTLSIHDCFLVNIQNYKECLLEYNHNLFKIAKNVSIEKILINNNYNNMFDTLNDFFNKNNNLNNDSETIIWIFKYVIKFISTIKKFELNKEKNNGIIKTNSKIKKDNIFFKNDINKFIKNKIFDIFNKFEEIDESWKKNIDNIFTIYDTHLEKKTIHQIIKDKDFDTINKIHEIIMNGNKNFIQNLSCFISFDISLKWISLKEELDQCNDLKEDEYRCIKNAQYSLKPE